MLFLESTDDMSFTYLASSALLSVYNRKHNDVTIVIVWLKPYLETIK